ncbi:MAG: hypothetical protein MAG431_02513 [Chloroflexi bacterium]|nr:hypothetical protein [Chloroflexota bacterium]
MVDWETGGLVYWFIGKLGYVYIGISVRSTNIPFSPVYQCPNRIDQLAGCVGEDALGINQNGVAPSPLRAQDVGVIITPYINGFFRVTLCAFGVETPATESFPRILR